MLVRGRLIRFSCAAGVAMMLFVGASMRVAWEPKSPYFDSPFDGAWVGSLQPRGPDKRLVPALLSINVQGEEGLGFAWLPANPATPVDLSMLKVRNLRRRDRKIVFELESSATAILRHKRTEGILAGRLLPTAEATPRGRITLWRADSAFPIQRTWVGSVDMDGISTSMVLQVLVHSRSGGENARAQTKRVDGFGYLGSQFGELERGRLSGDALAGQLAFEGGALRFELELSRQRLAGTIEYDGISKPVSLTPVATGGKRGHIDAVAPGEAPVGAPLDLRITGKNLSPGIVVHVADWGAARSRMASVTPSAALIGPDASSGAGAEPPVLVRTIEYISSEEIRVRLVPDYGTGHPRTVSLRLVAPDGQVRDRRRALALFNPERLSFDAHIQPVFSDSCALSSCHTNPAPAALLNLSTGAARASIVGVRSTQLPTLNRIEPRDPANSYLIRKLEGEGITGARMPQGAPPLSDGMLALFDRWVLEGAKRR